MFGLFKKKKKETNPKGFYSMVSGTSMDITEVDDEMFAGKLLGDGIAVKPSDDLFVAPCNGTITTVMDSKHAIGLEDENGVQVLIHIGLDTVTLNGEGFEVYCKVGDKVQVGAPLVKVDRKLLQEKNIPDVTMMVFIELNGHEITTYHTNETVAGGKNLLIEYQ